MQTRDLAALQLRCPIAEHQVRKIEIELVRRYIRALRHEAHVAQCASIDDRPETSAVDRIQFAGFRVVYEIKETGETVAQIEAAPAAVTNVEDPAEFRIDVFRVVKVGIFPTQGMSDGWIETALAHDYSYPVPAEPAERRR
ncbi:MAG: hypothetical protein ACREEV_10620 [Dongiaceae bacterium]